MAVRELDRTATNHGEAIHSARKHFKKLRGLLRLVRRSAEHFEEEDAAVREIARGLSAARDANVLIETFDSLIDETHPNYDALRKVREILVADHERWQAETDESVTAAVKKIQAMRDRAERWSLERKGFRALRGGLKTTYAAAQDGMDRARRRRTAEAFHEWRKAVKYHGYHIALLREAAPEILKPVGNLWEQFGERLGDHHNLAVLKAKLEERPETGRDNAQLHGLREAIDERLQSLETEAFVIGRQLLAEHPKAMAQRFDSYWAGWIREG
jgi:CHAD domain-containing protein